MAVIDFRNSFEWKREETLQPPRGYSFEDSRIAVKLKGKDFGWCLPDGRKKIQHLRLTALRIANEAQTKNAAIDEDFWFKKPEY